MSSATLMSQTPDLAARANEHPATLIMRALNEPMEVLPPPYYYDTYGLHLIKNEVFTVLDALERFLTLYTQDFDLEDTNEDVANTTLMLQQLATALKFIAMHGAHELMGVIARAFSQLTQSPTEELAENTSVAVMLLKRFVQFTLNKQILVPHFLLDITNTLQLQLQLPHLSEGVFLGTLIGEGELSVSSTQQSVIDIRQLQANAVGLARLYQKSLLAVLANKDHGESITLLGKVTQASYQLAVGQPDENYWYAIMCCVHEVSACLPLSNSRKRVLITAERHFVHFGVAPSHDVLMDAYAFALSRDHALAKQLRVSLALEGKVITDAVAMPMYKQMFGPSFNAISAVVDNIGIELQQIKETLAKPFLATQSGGNSELEALGFKLLDVAHVVAFVIDFDDVHQRLTALAGQLSQSTGQISAQLHEAIVLAITQTENCLLILLRQYTTAGALIPIQNSQISQAEVDAAYVVLLDEARSSIAVCAASLESFRHQPSQLMHVQTLPMVLNSLKGAADFLFNPLAGGLLKRLGLVLEYKVSEASSQERLAIIDVAVNVLGSLDHFFANIQAQLPTALSVFEMCDVQLKKIEKTKVFASPQTL